MVEMRMFQANSIGHQPLVRQIAAHLSGRFRILDIGCGDGSLIFSLSNILKGATFFGVDMDAENIRNASRSAAANTHFERADYLTFSPTQKFDAAISHSTLHTIPVKDPLDLFKKIAGDMENGSILAATIPCACLKNSILIFCRRLAGKIRSPAMDRILLHAGSLMTRMPKAMLTDRIQYMYSVPSFLLTDSLLNRMPSAGFNVCVVLDYPSQSPLQLAHKTMIVRRVTDAPLP